MPKSGASVEAKKEVVPSQSLEGSPLNFSSLHAVSAEADSMNANTEYIIVFIIICSLIREIRIIRCLLRQVIECVKHDTTHVVVVVRLVWGRRIPVEESGAEADNATLTEFTVSTLQLP